MIISTAVFVALAAAPLSDADQQAWDAFAESRNGECMGPEGELGKPIQIEVGGHKYRLEGHRLVQLDKDRDHRLRIGVLSATKDDRQATLQAIRELKKKLMSQGMDILVVNGDIAAHDVIMHDELLPVIADSNTLVLVTAGNTESCGSFNRSVTKVFRKMPHLINGNWVRVLELDDATLVTQPGYHDRRFRPYDRSRPIQKGRCSLVETYLARSSRAQRRGRGDRARPAEDDRPRRHRHRIRGRARG